MDDKYLLVEHHCLFDVVFFDESCIGGEAPEVTLQKVIHQRQVQPRSTWKNIVKIII